MSMPFRITCRAAFTRRTLLPLTLASFGLNACANDAPLFHSPTGVADASLRSASHDAVNAIVVTNTAELMAALTPANAGRRIRLIAGAYEISQTLTIPDGVILEGEGVMRFDEHGLPTGFAPGTETVIQMTANVGGDVLELGHGAVIRRMTVLDAPARPGNVIGVVSRAEDDEVTATISEVELRTATGHGAVPAGPIGCAISVLSRNLNLGGPPGAHAASRISAKVTHSILRAPNSGVGCGVFAFNFAPSSTVTVTLAENVVGGGLIATGGVSRPDGVFDSETAINSQRNLYRADATDACGVRRVGWNLQGGSGTPINLPNPGATNNTLRVVSHNDRLEGFTTGVAASAGRRFFPAPSSGPVSGNRLALQMIGTHIDTPSCGGAPFVADLRLAGAQVADGQLVAGDDNVLHAVFRQVTGSGTRFNAFENVLGPSGSQPSGLQGSGNRLIISGTLQSFERTNRHISPAPSATLFSGDLE